MNRLSRALESEDMFFNQAMIKNLGLLLIFLLNGCATKPQEIYLNDKNECISVENCITNIYEKVSSNWVLPVLVEYGLRVELTIRLSREGRILSSEISKASGSIDLDKSALKAVSNSQHFLEIQGLSYNEYEEFFHTICLVFRPEKT